MPGPKKLWVPWRMTGKPISRKTSLEQYNFRKSGGGGGGGGGHDPCPSPLPPRFVGSPTQLEVMPQSSYIYIS